MLDGGALLKAPIILTDLLRPRDVQPHLAILIYHQVLDKPDPLRPGVILRKNFERHMAMLRRNFRPIALFDAYQRLNDGMLKPRSVCVTFDDGYADNLTVAAPILAKYGIPSTVFVASGYLDGGVMWNDRIVEAVRHANVDSFDGSLYGLEEIPIKTVEDKRKAIADLLKNIKHRPMDVRTRLVEDLEQRLKARYEQSPMLTTEQLRMLSQSGVDIGAHTINHPILKCEDDITAKTEIVGGKARLEDLLQNPVPFFAYPNGRRGFDYDERHREIVSRADYFAAVSTDNGSNKADTDCLQLYRFTPWDTSSTKFTARLMLNEWRVSQA